MMPGTLARRRIGFVAHVGNGAARHVVQDHRQIHRFRDLREMAVDAFLRRLVVIRDDLKRRVGADLLRRLRELDRLSRGVAARSPR